MILGEGRRPVVRNLQSDSLGEITQAANASGVDFFLSIHCNAYNGRARGSEVEVFPGSRAGRRFASYLLSQIIDSLGTLDRGLKDRPNLYVLKHTRR